MSGIPKSLSAYRVMETAAEFCAFADDLRKSIQPFEGHEFVSIRRDDLATMAALLVAAGVIIDALVTSLEHQDGTFALPPLDPKTAWVPTPR